MTTSIKLKFTPSKITNKVGIIRIQLIHNRKTKLIRTRFRLFPTEWDSDKETVLWFVFKTYEKTKYLLCFAFFC